MFSTVIYILPWLTLLAYTTGPSITTSAIRLGDWCFLLSFPIFLWVLISRGIPIVRDVVPVVVFALYLGLILIFPLIGLLFFEHVPAAHILGDYRWLMLLACIVILWVIYRGDDAEKAEKHFLCFLTFLSLIQLLGLFFQIAMSQLGLPPGPLLETWYPEGSGGYGKYGHHIGRYAALLGTASALSFVGGLSFLVGSFRVLYLKIPSHFLIMSGLLFIVAGGTRAMLFGAPIAAMLIAAIVRPSRQGAVRGSMLYLPFIFLLPILGYILMSLDIGRIASGNRLQSTISWIGGQASFVEISGRGGVRWEQPITQAYTHWSPVGTLVNPSHALDDLPAFDSYWVFMIAQAGPFLVVSFGLVMLIVLYRGHAHLRHRLFSGVVAMAGGVTILISSITQNTMSSLPPRVVLLLAILFIILSSKDRRCRLGYFRDSH